MDADTEAIQELLHANNIFGGMFDILRMVDPDRGLLLEWTPDGNIRKTDVCCTDVFGSNERCRNCTSSRAFYADRTMVKLEYSGGAVLLIMSTPVAHREKRIIVEMVKDISESMTMDVQDKHRVDGVTSIIQNLNAIATTDVLTGLFNRRYLEASLPKLIKSSQRIGVPLCVALLDIDNFKRVNDTYGHQNGDRVLASVAGALSGFVRRSSDWGARYGGEELFVCFAGIGLGEGEKILERVRRRIEETRIQADGQSLSVTVSIGLVELLPDESMEDLIARCDKLLYQAKQKGKNRVEFKLDNGDFQGK